MIKIVFVSVVIASILMFMAHVPPLLGFPESPMLMNWLVEDVPGSYRADVISREWKVNFFQNHVKKSKRMCVINVEVHFE